MRHSARTGRPSVAVCIDTRDGPGRERLLGVYRFAVERGWRLYLVRGDGGPELMRLRRLPLDGAILYDKPASVHRILRARRVPCVETGARNLELDDGAVFVDDRALTRVALGHLAGLGVAHYAYCGLGRRFPSTRRAESFRRHAGALGFPVAAFEESAAEGEAELERLIGWLRRLRKPVGLLAYDDKMAERVLAACAWAGIAVPGEVAVLGIGNDELMCQLARPALSSVALPTVEIGRRAAERLDALLRGRGARPRHEALAPREVIARASTDRFPSADAAVAQAVAYIVENDCHPMGTDQVAEAAGLSRRTMERRFRSVMGRTVHDFLAERRLRRAAELLRLTDCSLPEAARRCGYGALSAFIRAFAKEAGCHPREYRARYR